MTRKEAFKKFEELEKTFSEICEHLHSALLRQARLAFPSGSIAICMNGGEAHRVEILHIYGDRHDCAITAYVRNIKTRIGYRVEIWRLQPTEDEE